MTLLSLTLQAPALLAIFLGLYFLWVLVSSPLKSIPGPIFAKCTNLWRLLDAYGGRSELTHRLLHEKYGSAVRIGPNVVSVSDPKLLRTIYNTRGDFLKSKFYTVNDTKVGPQIIKNVFSTQSNDFHLRSLRPIQKFYKMSNLMKSEPLVDETVKAFIEKIDEKFVNGLNANTSCKMDDWLLFFAWDVVGQLTFSKPMGFMDEGFGHHDGLLSKSEMALDYFAAVGQIPALDHWLAKNPVYPIGPPSFDHAAMFCAQQSIARQQAAGDKDAPESKDMLGDFLEVKKTNPEQIDDNGVVSALLVNVLAGADTTAILLRSIFYFVLKNPTVYKRLQRELDAAKLPVPAPYAAASSLPFLDSVIRESGRMHPGVGLLLERVVPEGGLTLSDGRILPPGTIVGMSPWVVHQNKEVFGQDAASFNPQRWLPNEAGGETQEDFEARVTLMKNTDLTFGAGNRVCLGKNVTLLETYKVIATLFMTYDMALVHPEKEWKVQNSWFVRQKEIDITFARRGAVKA